MFGSAVLEVLIGLVFVFLVLSVVCSALNEGWAGLTAARARVLEMTFTPLGDAEGRTAWVHLVGGPSDPELTAPIDTRVNVRGPLDKLVKIGADMSTDSRLRFKGAK